MSDAADAAENLVRRMLQAEPLPKLALEILQGGLDHSINRRRHWPFPTLGRTYGFRLEKHRHGAEPAAPGMSVRLSAAPPNGSDDR